jgi:putative chitinase
MTTLADIQRHLGVDPDGKLGPVTLGAIAKAIGMTDAPAASHRLASPEAFFAAVRKITGPLDQVQVDTINGLLAAASHWRLSWLAYGLATAWHEARFKPIEEWGKGKGRPYSKPGKYGQSQHGRGLVQLTWDRNYEWADKALGLGGSLLKDFNRALEPEIATAILVKGMETGAFTGKGLADYLPDRLGTPAQYREARRIINGTDRAEMIAGYAERFQAALEAGGWA